MFKGPAHTHGAIRTVLTKGVAGIGKTVLTQKFSLDWAQVKHEQKLCSFEDLQVLFIFDGLDECRPPLDFTKTEVPDRPHRAKVKNIKYEGGSETDLHWSQETRKMVKSLGKLAFEQLQKGNLIFNESDLSECGLDAAVASVSFLAALHVHQTFINTGINLLNPPQSSECPDTEAFYCSAVDQALQSPNGHLDLLLRFLLGLSLSTNQSLLQGLLTQTGSSSQTNQKTAEYIKEKLSKVSAERSINLLHCLNELNDRSLVEQIQLYLSLGRLSEGRLSPAQWSALAFILLSSEEDLDQFELNKYCASEEGLQGLLPVVKASTKALLSGCNLSKRSCEALSSVLSSQSSSLRVLDLSLNHLKDSGLKMLCVGLKSRHCKLEQLSDACFEFLDALAPLRLKCTKPMAQLWLNEKTREARRSCRRTERKWNKEHLQVSLQMSRDSLVKYQNS
ncbi:NLR family CARD domain-containing protein 3-like [Boleophthalmus pectinirostris]|uniref:NLR family CARD domain-containing protein 3-like n=1 Tax=Boleophthalmus pectinirostris TaxID=150288 RepID=UPI00242D90AB|nr:NLR family CARD domain-containing protein 3-like [Boleophthalmus pectinirostris]